MRYIFSNLILMSLTMLSLQGCSGGTASDTVPFAGVVSKTITGTASQGAALTGTAYLKDVQGTEIRSSIDSNGRFKFYVNDMKAPFILKAGSYYSATESTSATNINPLTDLCVKKAAGVSSVDAIYNNPAALPAIMANITYITNNLITGLDALYPSSVPATQRNFMNGSLVIDQGVDLVFTKINIVAAAGDFTINHNGQTIVSVITSNGIVTVSNNPANIVNASTDIFPNSDGTDTGGGNTSTPDYTRSDLQGTWQYFQLIIDSNNSYWAQGLVTIDANAQGLFSGGTKSDGGTSPTTTWGFAITSDGTVSITSPDPDPSTKMYMTSNRQLIIGTGGTPIDKSLYIMVKTGDGFQQSDLQGTWKLNGLFLQGTSGNTYYNGWSHADVNISDLGATVLTNFSTNISGQMPDSPDNLTLDSQGIVTASTFAGQGVLSSDKNLMIYAGRKNDGTIGLYFYVRTGGTSFSLADMQGSWRTNYLMLQGQTEWGRATTTFDTLGNAVVSSITQSNSEVSDSSASFSVMSTGGILSTSGDWPWTFSGIMALNKKLMVGTVTQGPTTGTPSPSLFIWSK